MEKKAHWINESEMRSTGDVLEILAPAQCDLFCALDGQTVAHNAPMYGWQVEGDCVLEARVSFTRTGDYDGAGPDPVRG